MKAQGFTVYITSIVGSGQNMNPVEKLYEVRKRCLKQLEDQPDVKTAYEVSNIKALRYIERELFRITKDVERLCPDEEVQEWMEVLDKDEG